MFLVIKDDQILSEYEDQGEAERHCRQFAEAYPGSEYTVARALATFTGKVQVEREEVR